jgi:beta-galactosidase/beta-glucuronidase
MCGPFLARTLLFLTTFGSLLGGGGAVDVEIPLPEHPRPDFERVDWSNLNGDWSFRFDAENVGLDNQWFRDAASFTSRIVVPFSWGAPLSGVPDQADVGWYARTIKIPESWAGKRVFLVIGAADWETRAWLDGRQIGTHRGGYTPFEFELTPQIVCGDPYLLVLRVDDSAHEFKLEGKQGYGPARGIWQTPYLEARGSVPIETVHFTPDLAGEKVKVDATLSGPAPRVMTLHIDLAASERSTASTSVKIPKGETEASFEVLIANPRAWSLEDPFLYQAVVSVTSDNLVEDRVKSYFGMREISVVPLPGYEHPYIALNGEPVYLQMALDQAYHPEGFYTFPSDQFMKDEILRSLRLGLNGIRIHVKIGIPRKLYWADRLGLLVMADVPNSWGEPDAEMRAETELALKGSGLLPCTI